MPTPAKLTAIATLALALIASVNVARACAECGGMGSAVYAKFSAAERAPKASQLYPDAPVVEYALEISEQTLSPAGKPVKVLTVNGTSPGPVLRFHEGDVARIRVINRLAKEETSVHWHGLLVPNLEDGVSYLTTPPIMPGKSRVFEFRLKQSGTYWYHSHSMLQEQRGIHGAIVVLPKAGTPARTDIPKIDRDEVVVLTDWNNENADEVMRTLHRGSDWYALRKGTAQSVIGAWRSGHLRDYLQREKARLPAMDVSDVAYDAFLANGIRRQQIAAKPGETVRLRVINAGASSYFYLSSAAGPLTVIAADGVDVKPFQQNRLLMGMAETYDVLVKVPAQTESADKNAGPASPDNWEIRATSLDNAGHTSVFIGDSNATAASEKTAPAPGPLNAYSMDEALSAMLDEADIHGDITDAEALATEMPRPSSPYVRLKATQPTTLPAAAPVRELTLKLTGDMIRYTWSLDDKPLSEASAIPVKRGEILRLTLVNNTMMHHPMHLHGHFFRLLMPEAGDRAFAPLKHTVDVPPMSRRVIEFYADEQKDWLFHCHLLYHHKAGMARVFSYDDQGPDHRPNLGEHQHEHTFFWVDGNVQSQMSQGLATLQRGSENLNLAWELGWERVERHEYEIDATYSHYFNARWTAFAGYRLTNIPGGADSVIAGATYLLPYRFAITGTLQSNGEARLSLAKTIPLTARLGLYSRAEYDTEQDFAWAAGLTYTLTKQFSLIGGYDSDYGAGAGVAFRF